MKWFKLRYLVLLPVLAHVRALLKSRELEEVRLRSALATSRSVVIMVVQNEMLRIPFLLEYYRSMGFEHFIFIDNCSSDGSEEFLVGESDVSIVRANGNFRSAHFGFDWINAVSRRWCREKWILCVDADEHLVFSAVHRSVDHLFDALDRLGKRSLQTLMLDMYSDRPSRENDVLAGTDPLRTCSLYDRSGYQAHRSRVSGVTWIKGGVRGRVFFSDDPKIGPALNKTPLVKWRLRNCFLKSTHELWPRSLNGEGQFNGVLLHFKFTQMSVSRMVALDYRLQHTEEYLHYDGSQDDVLVDDLLTGRLEDASNLVDDGLFVPLLADGTPGTP